MKYNVIMEVTVTSIEDASISAATEDAAIQNALQVIRDRYGPDATIKDYKVITVNAEGELSTLGPDLLKRYREIGMEFSDDQIFN